jgi:phosphatidylinositol kinase/protein kinase (PI-3  family)
MENREMLKCSQDYEHLTVMQKVEIFSEALDQTTGKGNDIHDVLWIKSTNSEEWLDRRTKFTRSIAVMSMVGYILGLGDRHPSNLMLDQISGRVLHIDFGDCFEVAINRDKFPEKVPFRLTRMLIKAMEVSGIEGSYRDTCERTMTVLRDNRDSLVAMLEAFVYDPLISWRLLGQSPTIEGEDTQPFNKNDVIQQAQGFEQVDSNTKVSRGIAKIREDSIIEEDIFEEPVHNSTGQTSSAIPVKALSDVSFLGSNRIISVGAKSTDNLNTSHLRSVKMYSDIQSLASNVHNSSRIASITGDGSVRNFAAESLSRSRLDKSVRQRESVNIAVEDKDTATEEALNEKALKVIRRVQDKLTGTDFHPPTEEFDPLDVQDQVHKLIVQATSTENLCQLFIGWCAFW